MPPQQPRRKPPAADHSGPRIDDHRPRPQRRSPRTAARPRGRQTPASRTQTRIRPESAQNRQNPHCPRRRRSKNATGSVLSDFSRGSGVYNLAIRSARQAPPRQRERGIRYSRQVKTPAEAYAGPGSKPRPSEEEPPETDPCRHHRTAGSATTPTPRRRHAPRTPGGPSRLDSSHAPGRPVSPPCRRRPDHRSARTPPGASRLVPHTLGAALPVLCAARRLAVEERTNRCANAATRSRSISLAPRKKKSEAPHTRQRRPPLAVKCAELPQLPQRSTGRRNPTPQHPRSAANRIARRRRASPPDQSRKFSRWGRPGFRRPAPPGRQAHVYAPHNRSPRPTAKARRTCQGLLHYRTGGKRAAARRKRFKRFSPSRIQATARPACVRRTSCRRNQGEKRMNPVMKVPCQNRPPLLPTGRWSGGRMRRGGGAIASTMRAKARARSAASRPRDSPCTYMCVNICQYMLQL